MTKNDVLEQLIQALDELGVEESDPSYEAAVITVAALFVGPNVDAIVDLTECTRDIVDTIASRMRASGLWTDQGVDYEDWFSSDVLTATINFMFNVGVAEGTWVRTGQKNRNGNWNYQLVAYKRIQC
jgi:hypothetical protein